MWPRLQLSQGAPEKTYFQCVSCGGWPEISVPYHMGHSLEKLKAQKLTSLIASKKMREPKMKPPFFFFFWWLNVFVFVLLLITVYFHIKNYGTFFWNVNGMIWNIRNNLMLKWQAIILASFYSLKVIQATFEDRVLYKGVKWNHWELSWTFFLSLNISDSGDWAYVETSITNPPLLSAIKLEKQSTYS